VTLPGWWPDWAREDYEERAAIMEYHGVIPVGFAEEWAAEDIRDRLGEAMG